MIEAVTRRRALRRRSHGRATVSVAAPIARPTTSSRRASRRDRPRRARARVAASRRACADRRAARHAERSSRSSSAHDATSSSQRGCATPDHVIRTKPRPLLVRRARVRRRERARRAIEREIATTRGATSAYFERDRARKKSVTTHEARSVAARRPRAAASASLAIGKTHEGRRDRRRHLRAHHRRDRRTPRRVGAYRAGQLELTCSTSSTGASSRRSSKSGAPSAARAARRARHRRRAPGIGSATAARCFAELGAHVVLVRSRRARRSTPRRELARKQPGAAASRACDVDEARRRRGARSRSPRARFGGVDIVVCNAGTAPEGALDTSGGRRGAPRIARDEPARAPERRARRADAIDAPSAAADASSSTRARAPSTRGPASVPTPSPRPRSSRSCASTRSTSARTASASNAVNADRIRTEHLRRQASLEVARARRAGSRSTSTSAITCSRARSPRTTWPRVRLPGQAEATTGCVVTVDGGNAAAFPR